jgi:hypothetical protein
VDANGDGKADQRQVFEGGSIARIEADTNQDGRPDVVQYLSGTNVVRQCQDDSYDGTVDACFEGEKVVPVTGVKELRQPLGSLDCAGFDAFWKRR